MTSEDRKPPFRVEDLLRGNIAVIVLAGLCVWAYVDLKSDIAGLAVRGTEAVEAPAAEEQGAVPPEPPPAPLPEPAPEPAPGAQIGWECSGAIEHEKVIAAIGKQGQAVFDCYSRSLVDAPDLKGTLVLELNVGKEGQVREARVKGPVKDPSLLSCVSGAVYEWTFPVPEAGDCAVVSVPFLLDPEDHAPAPAP